MSSKLILGTVQFGLDYGINNNQGKPGEETVDEILEYAYRSGIHQLDTAEAYGNAQEIIGRVHQRSAIRFDINTKFKGVTKGGLRSELIKSLKKLHTGKINTWFYHSFHDYASNPDLLDELANIKAEGLVMQIGVSVYSNSELETVSNDPAIDVIQTPFNLLDNTSQRGLMLRKAKEKKKTIQVRSVFLQGLFFKKTDTLPVYLLPLQPYLKELHKLSLETGMPMESLCLQYVNAQPDIDEIIIGVDSKEHLVRNIDSCTAQLDQRIGRFIDSIHVTETELLYPFNWK